MKTAGICYWVLFGFGLFFGFCLILFADNKECGTAAEDYQCANADENVEEHSAVAAVVNGGGGSGLLTLIGRNIGSRGKAEVIIALRA